ncbi:MAG: dephospho-CoA kinase [Butyrivibrio sp.]|nr:dephospho-CoA kinase [Butyrivibrio sp.]
MRVIGITGGVGAGKSTVLAMLKELCRCELIIADDVAKSIMEKGGPLTGEALRLFGSGAYLTDGTLNRSLIASAIYGDAELLKRWNGAVHPAVNREIRLRIERARKSGLYDFIFVEAALLIENGYGEICDELWYVYADETARRERLRVSRGYDDAKTESIMKNQLDDAQFRRHCDFVVDTGGGIENTRHILQNRLEVYN